MYIYLLLTDCDFTVPLCYFLYSFTSTDPLFVWQECARRVHLSPEKRIISELKETSSWRELRTRKPLKLTHATQRAFNAWKGAMSLYCSFYLDAGKYSSTTGWKRLANYLILEPMFTYLPPMSPKIRNFSKSSWECLFFAQQSHSRTCAAPFRSKTAPCARVIKIDSI